MKVRFLNQKFKISQLWKLRFSIFKVLFSPRKIWNFILVFISKALKRGKALGLPLTLMLELSSRCDMTCPMCPVILNKTMRNKGDMSLGTFKKVIDEVGKNLLFLALWNYGEPLLNKDTFSMIEYAHKKSIITIMSTNALSLDKSKAGELLNSNLDYLIVSFDGAREESYEKFRGKGNFKKVSDNVKTLLELKKEARRKKPFVNLQCIVMKDNENEIPEMRDLAFKLGVDKLSLKKFTYLGKDEVQSFLPREKKYLFEKYKNFYYPTSCLRILDSSVVLWDGAVVPCCGDLDFRYNFGSINDDGKFMDIWNSPKYVKFRKKALTNTEEIDICRKCPSRDYSVYMFIE